MTSCIITMNTAELQLTSAQFSNPSLSWALGLSVRVCPRCNVHLDVDTPDSSCSSMACILVYPIQR